MKKEREKEKRKRRRVSKDGHAFLWRVEGGFSGEWRGEKRGDERDHRKPGYDRKRE